MDAIECIKTRMSIRKFKHEPVPREILLSIVETAQRSPSYKNSQPWEVVIVSGERKEALSKALVDLIEKDTPPKPDIPEPVSWPTHIEQRMAEHMKKRSEKFGLNLADPGLLKRSKMANSRFYGAPHGIFLFQDSSLPTWSIFDMGLFAQSLMLAANARGIGTVPQAFLTDYPATIKEFLQIPETKRLILGISAGYPDWEDKANSYKSQRVDVSEIVKWIE
ncbi:MAG: nitroreductase [Deltaproteobacteria bacterium]